MVDVEPAFVTDRGPPKLVEPSEDSLDGPSMTAKLLAVVDLSSSDTWLDAAEPTCIASATVVIGFVGMQLVRPPEEFRAPKAYESLQDS